MAPKRCVNALNGHMAVEPSMSNADDPLYWLEAERTQPGGSRVAFHLQMQACEAQLIAVADLVGEQVVPVTEAFLEADAYAARAIIAGDVEVDRRCEELEEACFLILARQSPVAVDLRRIVAILRSVADVQRAGNLLSHIAESLTWVHPPAMGAELLELLARLGQVSGTVFSMGVQAWRDHDALAAVELQQRDDEVDLLQQSLLSEVYTGGRTVEEAASLALICRYYERIADHGVEMARQVAWFLTGERPPED